MCRGHMEKCAEHVGRLFAIFLFLLVVPVPLWGQQWNANNNGSWDRYYQADFIAKQEMNERILRNAMAELSRTHEPTPTSIPKMLDAVARTLSLHEMAGDKVAQMLDHTQLARISVDAHQPQKALSEVATAESIAKPLSDQNLDLQLLQIKTAANIASGKFEEAIETNKEIMKRFQGLNDEHGQAETYFSSGWAFESLGNAQQALDCYESALGLFSKLGDKEGRSRVLIATGSLYQSMGDFHKAEDEYSEAFPSMSREQEARIDASVAEIDLALGNPSGALAGFQGAIPLVQDGKDFTLQGSLLAGIGRCHMALHSYGDAQNDFDQARAKIRLDGNIAMEAGV